MVKLETAHKEFIKHLEEQGKTKATLVAYSKDIEQLTKFLEKEGLVLINETTLDHLERFMKNFAESNYTPKSVSRKTNATKTFFKFLAGVKYITENPAQQLKHPKFDTKAPRILSKLEYRALRDAARNDTRSYAIIEIMLQTGITISELAGMKMEHLDIKGDTGNLLVPKKEGREARTVPLNKMAVEALKKYLGERPKVEGATHAFITKSGKALLVRNIRSTIDRFFEKAGVENAKVNDLRHTFVAFHLTQGVNVVFLQKVAGHKRASTTERYIQYVGEVVSPAEKTELGIL